MRYCDLDNVRLNPWMKRCSTPNKSEELVYKCKVCEPRFPGGKLKISQHIEPPTHDQLEWIMHTESLVGPDTFLEQILNHVKEDKSFTCLGSPGVGKTFAVDKVYNNYKTK